MTAIEHLQSQILGLSKTPHKLPKAHILTGFSDLERKTEKDDNVSYQIEDISVNGLILSNPNIMTATDERKQTICRTEMMHLQLFQTVFERLKNAAREGARVMQG